jgi:hypothetical protein
MKVELHREYEISGAHEEWTTRYEDLRRGVLDGGASGSGRWGYTLFARQGLVAWMRAWPKRDAARDPGGHQTQRASSDRPSLPSNLSEQITMVVVNMILGSRQEIAV